MAVSLSWWMRISFKQRYQNSYNTIQTKQATLWETLKLGINSSHKLTKRSSEDCYTPKTVECRTGTHMWVDIGICLLNSDDYW